MSLPIHLQSIKSSGVYRFVYDKSVINEQTAETLRLVVGYSDKGPFNTPVYITNRNEFIRTYGNISKRLEKKGVFFHRLALQALGAGPILCLNLKPFGDEAVDYTAFKGSEVLNLENTVSTTESVKDLYNTNRFWTLDAEKLATLADSQYIVVSATDSLDASCSIIVRKAVPTEYNLTIREWYAGVTDEMPDYLSYVQDDLLSDYFADVYVFKGQFTPDLCGPGGPLGRYFNVKDGEVTLEENYLDAFGEPADVLTALANDSASNYIAGYRGTTIPFFKSAAGNYIALDLLFNSGYSDHKMLMNMNEALIDEKVSEAVTDDAKADAIRDLLVLADVRDKYTYYELVESGDPATYSYTLLSNPTDAQMEEAVLVTSVPQNPTATSNQYIKVATNVDIVTYYERKDGSTEGTYWYDVIANPTKQQIKVAVEVEAGSFPTSAPEATTEDYGQVLKTVTVTGDSIQPVYLKGYTYTQEVSASKCLGLITDEHYGKGLQEALTNRIDVEYHYIVDAFDTAAGPAGAADKNILAALAKKKDNCFAILNFPKIKDFINAGSTYKTNGTLDFKKVVKDFPLPDDTDGASWIGYFTQLSISDGTVKSIVPSAGLVSNLFEYKWTARQPYYIVAGSTYGKVSTTVLTGPDYAFSKTDRDVLEPYGINVLVYEPRRGTYINSEQTAKQVPVSALSKIHVRELVIYLQDEIADMLEGYRWENNTQTLRDMVKAKADVLLETVKNNGGVYDYVNVCDESNNTPETIDNEFLVLDTHIEPARGAGKMVEQLFIYRTGEMRSQLISG